MLNRENGLLLLLQAATMLVALGTLKINLSHFSIVEIGTFNLFTATIALCASARLSGVDVCLTKGFREHEPYFTISSLFSYIFFGTFIGIIAAFFLLQNYLDDYAFGLLFLFYGVAVSIDRSTSYYLTHKKYLLHRSFLLATGVLTFIAAIACAWSESSIEYFIYYYVFILILIHLLKSILTLKQILRNLKGNSKGITNSRGLSFKHPAITFSFLGIFQAILGNIDRLIIGTYSVEILGLVFIMLIVPTLLKHLTQPIFVKFVYENMALSYKNLISQNFLISLILCLCSVTLGFYLIPTVLDVVITFSWVLCCAASIWILAGILESVISGRLTLNCSAVANMKIIIVMILIPTTLYSGGFLLFEELSANDFIILMTVSQVMRVIFVYWHYVKYQANPNTEDFLA